MSDVSERKLNGVKDRFSAFFSNPVVGIIGSIASVIGLLLAIYFYVESKETRQLICYVNPVKAVVIKTGQASRLTTSFDTKVVETDITAAQVAIWNQGEKSVKRDNILKPILIYTENNSPILEATLRKSSRDVVQLSLNTDELQKGRVSVSWNILEHNDGGVIQLIYAGDPSIKLKADGVVEGQGQIEQLEFSGRIKSPDEQYASGSQNVKNTGKLFLILALILTIYYIFNRLMRWRQDKKHTSLKEQLNSPDEEARKKALEQLEKNVHRLEEFIGKMNRAESIVGFLFFFILCVMGLYFLRTENIPPFGF